MRIFLILVLAGFPATLTGSGWSIAPSRVALRSLSFRLHSRRGSLSVPINISPLWSRCSSLLTSRGEKHRRLLLQRTACRVRESSCCPTSVPLSRCLPSIISRPIPSKPSSPMVSPKTWLHACRADGPSRSSCETQASSSAEVSSTSNV